MKNQTLNATEANKLQKLWMELDSNGPKSEIDKVCALYEQIPTSYIAQNDSGVCNVFMQGQPIPPGHGKATFDCTVAEAEAAAHKHGIQTVLRWNCAGQWFNA